ncbi:MAG TPA: DUF2203 domain-containing protein [Anaeromyxobacteraceae bacterium]|nr:DUF2203 domain-containing protein [Anaeromyxobacteraceae bacterium]
MAPRPPSQGPRMFTVEEANELVPDLTLAFGRLGRLRGEASAHVEALGGGDLAMSILEGEDAPAGHEATARRLRALVEEINTVVEQVNGMGCLVKDIDAGLVDFYGVRDGEPVFLCWQFGEPAVAHWHPVEAGFAARQPIEGVSIEPPPFPN